MKNWPFALWGEDGSDDDGDSGGDGADESSDSTETMVTMTQKELESTVARAASRASRKATKEMRSALGFESQEDLATFVEGTRKATEDTKDDAAKAQTALEEERSGLASAKGELRAEQIGLSIDRAIIMTGVTDEAKVKRIRTLVRSEMESDVEMGDLAETVADAMALVKTDLPSMFDTKSKNAGSGDGGAKDDPPSDEQIRLEADKKTQEEFARKGLIPTPQ